MSASSGVIWDQGSFSSLLFAHPFPHQRACLAADTGLALCNQLFPETQKCWSDVSHSAAREETARLSLGASSGELLLTGQRCEDTACPDSPLPLTLGSISACSTNWARTWLKTPLHPSLPQPRAARPPRTAGLPPGAGGLAASSVPRASSESLVWEVNRLSLA